MDIDFLEKQSQVLLTQYFCTLRQANNLASELRQTLDKAEEVVLKEAHVTDPNPTISPKDPAVRKFLGLDGDQEKGKPNTHRRHRRRHCGIKVPQSYAK